jgi:LDH2 family malate/lactate/ureidoglycolate dehydrogenase
MDQVVMPAAAHRFATDVLVALGMPADDAGIVADSMVWAGLHGRITHSLIRLDPLATRARAGGLALTTDWTPVRRRGVVTLMDARFTWGPLAGARGMRRAIANAEELGVGVTSIRNCDNTSALSWYSTLAAAEQLIGIAISNTLPLMTLWGGAEKLIGNQPMSMAVPAGKHPPIVLDQMFGAVRLDVPRKAVVAGESLPPGVVVDAEGVPTTDPQRYLDGGAVLPAAGHRGSGIALMWEVLTGVLSGGRMLTEILPPSPADQRTGNSLYLMALDPDAVLPAGEFAERVDRLIEQVHSSKPAPGVERVRVPGDERDNLAEERALDGIPFPAEHVETLRRLGADVGVAWPGG